MREVNQEEHLDKRLIIVSLVLGTVIMLLLFLVGLALDPPEYEGTSIATFLPLPGAIIAMAINAGLAGYLRKNTQTRKILSRSSYLVSSLIVYLCTWGYYYVVFPLAYPGDTTFYRDYYFGLWLLLGWIFVLIMLVLLILVNRIFIVLGEKVRHVLEA